VPRPIAGYSTLGATGFYAIAAGAKWRARPFERERQDEWGTSHHMELTDDYLDTIELTAEFRRHEKFETLRREFQDAGFDCQAGFLLTLDGTGAQGGLGIVMAVDGEAFEFEFGPGRFVLRGLATDIVARDELLLQTQLDLADETTHASMERSITEYPSRAERL
jgi:hypothetical protein